MPGFVMALGIGAAAIAGSAAAQPAPEPALISDAWTNRISDEFADQPAQAGLEDQESVFSGYPVFAAADFPDDLRARPFQTRTIADLVIDWNGRPVRCRVAVPSSDRRLDDTACRKLMAYQGYWIRYSAPQRPMVARWVVAVNWRTSTPEQAAERRRLWEASPPPPSPPRYDRRDYSGWPRLGWYDELKLVSSRDIQSDYPPEAYGEEGIVSLEYETDASWGGQECKIGIGSGNAALDKAACRVARKMELRYTKPCFGCMGRTIPLQIVWRKSGSHIRLPLRNPWPPVDPLKASGPAYAAWRQPLGEPFKVTRADFAGIADTKFRKEWLRLDVAIDIGGRPSSCAVGDSSGNPEVDRRICELLLRRARFTQRTDVFGVPAADQTEYFYVWLGDLL